MQILLYNTTGPRSAQSAGRALPGCGPGPPAHLTAGPKWMSFRTQGGEASPLTRGDEWTSMLGGRDEPSGQPATAMSPEVAPKTGRSDTGGAPGAARLSRDDQPVGPELLTDAQLAERWQLSRGTLANQRSQGRGPAYLKIAGRVRYRRSDIETYEQAGLMETQGPVDARIASRESIELLIRSAGA